MAAMALLATVSMSPSLVVAANGDAAVVKERRWPNPGPEGLATMPPHVTRHSAKIGGKTLSYTATAGYLPVLNDAGDTEASIFYVAYETDKGSGRNSRPLMFFFNGGPGAAAVWLHLGAAGPRRVEMLSDGSMPAPPFKLTDNQHSWLDKADLVFVDPVGTGYSRAAKPDFAKKFATVSGDIDALGRFVRLYLTRNDRWNSPLFLVGESYGSFRSAGLSDYLIDDGVALNGLILVSSVLNLQTISFDFGNDLPYQLALPSYTATAWYHKKLDPELQADLERTLASAEGWAAGEYNQALNKGDRLSVEERARVLEKMARFTGISSEFLSVRNLRLDNKTFAKELLGGQGQMVGVMDGRFKAENLDPGTGRFFDATVSTIRPPFTATFSRYAKEELEFESDLEYFTLGGGIERWDWEAKNSYADTSRELRDVLAKNPYMKVFIASGVFDLATPHFATEYTVAHLGLPASLRKNFTIKRYRSGHMMYLESSSLAQLKADIAEFIANSTGAAP
jgi:carboxypeptidase C (cathepsin A)